MSNLHELGGRWATGMVSCPRCLASRRPSIHPPTHQLTMAQPTTYHHVMLGALKRAGWHRRAGGRQLGFRPRAQDGACGHHLHHGAPSRLCSFSACLKGRPPCLCRVHCIPLLGSVLRPPHALTNTQAYPYTHPQRPPARTWGWPIWSCTT